MTLRRIAILLAVCVAVGLCGWFVYARQPQSDRWLGYADADYVKLAPTQQGRLTSLSVARGDQVAAGALLFSQDDVDDVAARDQAAADLTQASEKLADLQAAGRDAEIQQARADVTDMRADYDRVSKDLARSEALVTSGATTRQAVDKLRADTSSSSAKLQAAQAKLDLISVSVGRTHAIAAQQAAVASGQASLAAAQWRLDQRRVVAPAAGLIADTYARPGETIAAGFPVVSLLPPENILVRFFVPEAALARLKAGDRLGLACDSCPKDLTARVSFIATAPEYTPPVIYSDSTRGSLAYLIEARPDSDRHPLLKPGQPVDVIPVPGGQQN